MSTYQDVVTANQALGAWALTESSGTSFAPYIGGTSLVGSAPLTYRNTGPIGTDFAVGLGVGAKLQLPFATTLFPPVTDEAWFKLASLTVATYQILMRIGTTGSNGTGFYIATSTLHVHFTSPGSTPNDFDTGFVWPDTNWHLVDWVAEPTLINRLYIDGKAVWSVNLNNSSAPSPNELGYGCDGSSDTSKNALQVAWPAFYPLALSALNISATYEAKTDPGGALANTVGANQTNQSLLNQILAAVQKTFPTT